MDIKIGNAHYFPYTNPPLNERDQYKPGMEIEIRTEGPEIEGTTLIAKAEVSESDARGCYAKITWVSEE